MSLLALAEATAQRRWSRVGLVLWAWFCGLSFAVLIPGAALDALTGHLPMAAWQTFSACAWLYWAARSARRAT